MASRRIASLVLCNGRLCIPLGDGKGDLPDVSLGSKVEYLCEAQYSDVMIAVRNVEDLALLEPNGAVNLAVSLGANHASRAADCFDGFASKVFFRVDNVVDHSRFLSELEALNYIYGSSSFGINYHYSPDLADELCFSKFSSLLPLVSELTLINAPSRMDFPGDRLIDEAMGVGEEYGMELNIVAAMSDEAVKRCKEKRINLVNQFQIFTRWDRYAL